jgi:acetoin:2,6-dichlorophenolindophenol oxidoreductase subunit beta
MLAERIISAAEAIREGLDAALREHPEAYLIGEGVTDPGRIFGTTKGLLETYGPQRVMEMPVSENGLTGIAVGSALMGQRPIMTHQRVDFALLCLEQLFNTAAKSHYVTNGHHRVPMTVRMVIGRGWGQGPQHSQCLDALFAHIPGLKVVMPATPAQFKGLLLASIDDDNPVVFLEHRWLHYVTGPVPEGSQRIALDGPRVARRGRDVTIVATSYMMLEALRAADALARVGCECEVIDLRVLRPLVMAPIEESLQRTGRLIVCDTGWRTLGPGAEIVARLAEGSWNAFKRPPVRLGLPDHPTPSSLALAEVYYPDSRHIIDAVEALCDLGRAAADAARADAIAARKGVPIDKPDPAFKGPF